MWVKWTGALLIVAASVLWGNRQAAQLRRRLRQLEEFRLAMRLLTAEIGYTATPLPRALEHVRGRLRDEQVQHFLTEISREMSDPGVADASVAWVRAAGTCKGRMALESGDWPVILRAAAGLGSLGRESQMKQLEATEMQLAAHAAEAASQCERGERMWRYLGVMGGAAVVIVLL